MTLSFRSTQVTTPNASPTSSTTGGTYYVRHRRVNLDGGYTLWSNATSGVALPVTITPQTYGDSTQLLRDEILISEDDTTYKIVPRPTNGMGALSITTYDSGWTTATNQDTQNSIISSLDFGSFSNLSEPARTIYIFNSALSQGSLTFNFLETVTNQVATEYSGLILVELLGVIGAAGQNLSTSYNSQFLWVSPNLGLNTLALILPSSGFAKVRITLTNFPTGGLAENTIQLALQVTANQKKFPLSYGLDWANKTLLYSPNTGFDFPFISSSDGLTVTVDPFLFNYNGVLVGQFSPITLNLSEGVGDYTLTVNPNGTLQAWGSLEIVPENTQTLATFTTSLISPFITTITYTVGLRPQLYGQVEEPLTNMFARFISIDASNQAQLEDTTPVGVYVGNGYFTIAGTVILETEQTIAIGDNLAPATDGFAVIEPTGFLVARSTDFFGYVLADFRSVSSSTGLPAVNEALPAGLISGGELSINVGDPAKFDISAGTGRITDFYTDPLNPVIYDVSWSAFTAQTVTNIATATVTHIYIDNTGAIVQSTVIPTETLRRQYILLGQLGHTNNTTIGAVVPTPDIAASPISQLRDYADAVGIVNIGNTISPNGANLNINKTLGYLYKLGANFHTDPFSPTQLTIAAATAFTFRYRTQTGNGSTVSAIDPNNYDLAGVITTVPVNKVTNQRVFLGLNGNVVIQYGQVLYNSISAAITGIQTDSSTFIQFPNLTENFILIGIITVAQGSTNLSSDTQARFFKTSKFGESSASIAGSSVSTLQQAYENSSVDPEILTNSTGGAVAIRRGSAADTDNILVGENGAGTVTFSINGNGALLNTKLSQLATTTSAELAGVISDETGSGLLVFNNSPTFITPALGTPASGDLSNCSGLKTINGSSIFGAGNLTVGGGTFTNPVNILYFSPFTLTWSSGATMDNSLHNVFKLTVNSTGTLAHSNVPSSPAVYWFQLFLTISSGTFTPPASWTKGMTCPTAVGSYVIEGLTDDGGTSFIIGVIYL